MAAFVPRALAKPQKIPLPGKLVRKVGGLVDKCGASHGVSATGKVEQVDSLDEANQALDKEGRGGVKERASSHRQAGFSGRGNFEEERMGLVEIRGLEEEDDGPEVLQIEKPKQHAKRRRDEPQGNKSDELETITLGEVQASKKRRDTPYGASSMQEDSEMAETVSGGEEGQSARKTGSSFTASAQVLEETTGAPADDSVTELEENPASRGDEDLHSVQPGATMIGTDGRGGRTNGVAGKGAKRQGACSAKKLFPYGNYNRYYGYRFAKTLSEDPRLSVFQKEWFQGKACLDVGCNEGYVTIAVAQMFECGSMVGVDIDGSLVAKARSHLKREAAILRQANKPQRARLDLAGQADHPGVRQTLPGGTQSSRSMEGEPKQEKQQKRRRLAQENGTDHPPEVDTDETDRGGCCFVSEQGPTVGKSEAVRAVGVDADGRDMEGAADVSRDGAGGGADVSMGESGRGGIVGLREQTGNETLESTREASVCRGSLQEGGSPEDSDLVRIAEGENGELHEGPSLKTVLGERIGDDSRGGSLDEQEEGASIVGRPAGEVTGFLAGESPLEVKRFPQNVHFRKENFVVSPVDEEKYDVVMSLSVVKWIHLNWGDDGLLRFFAKVYKSLKPGGLFILEPQPWKSYKNNRAVSEATQRHFKEIKILPDQFPIVLQSKIGFRSADIVTPAVPGSVGGFGRAIHLYRK